MPDEHADPKKIVVAAQGLIDLKARAAYVDRACAGDADLRRQVEALLAEDSGQVCKSGTMFSPDTPVASEHKAHHTRPFVPQPTEAYRSGQAQSPGEQQRARASAALLGATIAGRYTLDAVIGEGGMGSVYRASQSVPVKRQVALKLIKSGMDSDAMLARFDAERQALALMDHPNIARIFDGGISATGQPFFVMELVHGVPLTVFCDQNRLSLDQRLRLFVAVCQAVQHAHQKGIIHRDLKPANVLVTEVDGRATPKVIDFGVAKATEQKLTDLSFTDAGAIVGTPEYMSPEQADPNAVDIDTRSDVYALGVMLYELLVGSTPIDARQFKRGAYYEILRMVREVEPARPSTRLSAAQALPNIAANRSIEPARLAKALRGELDWVVMKALEKERTRRYQTANGLARDLERYLADEPVEARPPSAGYRLGKFVRRHMGAVVAASLAVLALVGGILGTSLGLLEALRQERLALAARDAESQRAEAEARERQRAEKAEAETRQRANELEQVTSFQAKLFEELDVPLTGVRLRQDLLERVKAAGVKSQQKPDAIDARLADLERAVAGADFAGMAVKALEQNVFAPALATIEKQFADQPLVRSRLQQTLANTLRELGLLELSLKPQRAALETRRQQLGNNHLDTLLSVRDLSVLLRMRGQLDEAETLLAEAHAGLEKQVGALDSRTLGCVNLLGALRFAQGKWTEAAKSFAQALPGLRRVRGDDHVDTLDAVDGLGSALTNQGKFDEAEKLLLEAYQNGLRRHGADNTRTIAAANNLGALYLGMSRLDDAERYYRLALDSQRRTMGDLHPNTISIVDNLAVLLGRLERLDEAMVFAAEALKSRRLLFGDDSLTTLRSVNTLAFLLARQQKLPEAEANYRRAFEGYRRLLGPDRPDTLFLANNLGNILKDEKKYAEAEMMLRMVLEGRRKALGATNRNSVATIIALADLLDLMQRPDEAQRLLIDSLPAARAAYTGSELRLLGDYLSRLGDGYLRIGQFKPAEAALDEAQRVLTAGYGSQGDPTTLCVDRRIDLYTRWHAAEKSMGFDAKAEGLRAEAWRLTQEQIVAARKRNPPSSLPLAGELAKAGARLVRIKRYVEAEPVLQETLTIRTKAQPNSWTTFNTQSLLGGALLGQKQLIRAEPLLRAGYEGLKKQEDNLPSPAKLALAEALKRLTQLYAEILVNWGRP
jgi:tetratricopeptide (TPR) repeat protein